MGNQQSTSGAEQDRYGSHFGIGEAGAERLKHAAEYKGAGAEQERYEGHFGVDPDKVKAATDNLLHHSGSGAEQDRYEGHFGVGPEKVKEVVQEVLHHSGSGAEQDRYAGHFALGPEGVEKAKKLASMKGVGAEQVILSRFNVVQMVTVANPPCRIGTGRILATIRANLEIEWRYEREEIKQFFERSNASLR